MTTREHQAYNDGRNAYREGKAPAKCSRRCVLQRASWLSGYEHERRLDLVNQLTPGQLREASLTLRRLKDWVSNL